ncbi:MAG: cation diffusion facilitator family transporter [Clostridiales bacterium]|jgi:cation diffusion facilitator family transporter|nr:cation diffusion facilitator family transporter [Clostridiales bacterium]
MIKLLAEIFIKAEPNKEDQRIRHLYGVICGITGIALNIMLVIGKLLTGAASGSVAITADGLNNLSDAASSIIMLVSFSMARRKPDGEHPYGHGRMEYIAGLLVAVSILLMGAEIFRSSLGEILNPKPVDAGAVTFIVLFVSVAVKCYMAVYNLKIGKAIDSPAMRAVFSDSLADAAATGAVLLSFPITMLTGFPADGWCGLLVAAFIIYGGLKSLKEMVDFLLGRLPDPEILRRVKDVALAHPEVLAIHDLNVHDYGPGRRIIMMHAEVDENAGFRAAHEAIDCIERELQEELASIALIHMDPVDVNDPIMKETRGKVAAALSAMDSRITIHDFRMVIGVTHTNLIFDICAPFDVKMSDKEIKRRATDIVSSLDSRFNAVIVVDRVCYD